MLQRGILCMQGTQYATKRSILCRGAFCGPTKDTSPRHGKMLTLLRFTKRKTNHYLANTDLYHF